MKIAFKTIGCKLNQYDSQLLREMAENGSFHITSFNDPSDVYIINTCSVTMNALQQSRNSVRRARKRSKTAKIIVTGCFPEELREQLTEVDLFVPHTEGIQFFSDLFSSETTQITRFDNHTRPFVKIQTGCNKFCTYCIVPHLRGQEKSRPLEDIISEVRSLSQNGYKEISLTGVHIGRYFDRDKNLSDVLKEIESIEGIQRIRLGSLNPEEINDTLISTVSSSKKICHHFHISLQSADEKILRAMGRNYSPEYLSERIETLERVIPECGIGADIITGFPSEGMEEFMNTYSFIERMPFSYLHVFRYSPRKSTLAAILPNPVKESQKKKRSGQLIDLGLKKSIEFRQRYIGSQLTVLIEQKRDRNTNMMVGFSSNYIRVLVPEEIHCSNQFVDVSIESISGYDTFAQIHEHESEKE
jgi:threonylcarbamoyladenosine tRNA methylthiotransferase MtaB